MPPSLLGRIARHGVSGLRDPRDDRLTEICAAILAAGECQRLARHVVLGWLDAAAGDTRMADATVSISPRFIGSSTGRSSRGWKHR
jgi:hypothetical protein